ncbi:MAG: hypothetical protein NVSMB23_21890 [Myxococcales bacterium]
MPPAEIPPAEARARVLAFLRRGTSPVAVVEDGDERGARLLETGTGKAFALRWEALAQVEERTTRAHPQPYLILVFQDGRQIALAEVGFAFAPATHNSGALPELPQTLCFRDFATLTQGVSALIPQPGREQEAVRALLAAIALVDGARAAGFEVGREERTLEGLLAGLEERGARG